MVVVVVVFVVVVIAVVVFVVAVVIVVVVLPLFIILGGGWSVCFIGVGCAGHCYIEAVMAMVVVMLAEVLLGVTTKA